MYARVLDTHAHTHTTTPTHPHTHSHTLTRTHTHTRTDLNVDVHDATEGNAGEGLFAPGSKFAWEGRSSRFRKLKLILELWDAYDWLGDDRPTDPPTIHPRKRTHAPHERPRLARCLITFVSFLLLGFIPLFVYVADFIFEDFTTNGNLLLWSSSLTLFSFAAIGYLKGVVNQKNKFYSVLSTLLMGLFAALVAYYVGDVLEKMLL